ncbi:MAG TPA: hypothetical protein VFV38_08315 [Ktedonobacteraceae bacterium]|nr:hypothetical protein [Ktedonobacteraceae bacterium]
MNEPRKRAMVRRKAKEGTASQAGAQKSWIKKRVLFLPLYYYITSVYCITQADTS